MHKINKNIYGHFAEHLGRCVYEGIWVGEDSPIPNTRGIRNDVVAALQKIKPPVLRWPGGCFADDYHWMDGIGPRKKRPRSVNKYWGGVIENNHFGTHEFFDLCEMIGAEPYVAGNLGSGTVREMRDWVEYITFDGNSSMADLRRQNGRDEPWKLNYFGIGNENWGCGGSMRPEYYADAYNRYAMYAYNFSGNTLNRIACGPSSDNYKWTEVMMREVAANSTERMHGLSLHYYCKTLDIAAVDDDGGWFELMRKAVRTEELIRKHSTIMDQYDPDKRVALIVDEWGTWHTVEPGTNPRFLYQQNTIRDALVAGISLNIFNNHADRVRMANIAQTVNVLQAMILTEGEKMILTPTYHVFEMYKIHQDATLLPIYLDSPDYEFGDSAIPTVTASASRDADGHIHISLTNQHPHGDVNLSIEMRGTHLSSLSGRILTADIQNACNTFEKPDCVVTKEFHCAQIVSDTELKVALPSKSVVVLELS